MQRRYKIFLAALIIAATLLSTPAWSGFEESHEAYTKGEYATAFKGYLEAANNGDSRAYGKVAALYLYGRGTEKDFTQAYIWFGIAKANKDKYAARFQDTAASMLTRELIEQAELKLAIKKEKLKMESE